MRNMTEDLFISHLFGSVATGNMRNLHGNFRYNRKVVLGADTVEDDNGYRAIFAEQGASASQMAAARFLFWIQPSHFFFQAVEASDAVAAYTHVPTSEVPRLLGFPGQIPQVRSRLPPSRKTERTLGHI